MGSDEHNTKKKSQFISLGRLMSVVSISDTFKLRHGSKCGLEVYKQPGFMISKTPHAYQNFMMHAKA